MTADASRARFTTVPRPAAAPPSAVGAASGVLVLAGVGLLLIGTWLHPADADPRDTLAAFTEYAGTGRTHWVAAHLAQLAGLAFVLLGTIRVAAAAAPRRATSTAVCGSAAIAVAAVLQAVDGIALKAVVDAWSAAEGEQRRALYAAALAVRQIEIGLDGLLALLGAATVLGLAMALSTSTGRGRAAPALAFAAAVAMAGNGLLLCLDGYSDLAMLATTLTGGLTALAMVVLVALARHLPAPTDRRGSR